jgi:hypothetical protein
MLRSNCHDQALEVTQHCATMRIAINISHASHSTPTYQVDGSTMGSLDPIAASTASRQAHNMRTAIHTRDTTSIPRFLRRHNSFSPPRYHRRSMKGTKSLVLNKWAFCA